MPPRTTFDTELACVGDGGVIAVARREAPTLSTVLFAGKEQSGDWTARVAPGPVRHLAAHAGRCWLLVGSTVYEVRDEGGAFATLPLPNGAHFLLAAGDDGPWVASNAKVFARDGDEWTVRSEIPKLLDDEMISRVIPLADESFVLTNRLRIFRAAARENELGDYGAGLPGPLAGGAFSTVRLSVLDEWRIAYAGGLYLRRSDDLAWAPAADRAPPELAGVLESEAAEWVRAPWSRDTWIGHDGITLFESGPGRALKRLWRAPPGAPNVPNSLVAGVGKAFLSFRRATPTLSGLAIREHGIDEIVLPVA